MVSSFPKMQKSSASFSQSIRNRLRFKNLQAQAKNFCRVLDIRVSEIVESNLVEIVPAEDHLEVFGYILRFDDISEWINAYVVEVFLAVGSAECFLHFFLPSFFLEQFLFDERDHRQASL